MRTSLNINQGKLGGGMVWQVVLVCIRSGVVRCGGRRERGAAKGCSVAML